MNRRVIWAVVGALTLFAAAYIASPWWAARQFREAVMAGDIDALDDTVDFPALRESFKAQVNIALAAKMEADPEMRSNPFAGLGAVLLPAMVEKMADAVLTPDGLATLVRRGQLKRDASRSAPDEQTRFAAGYRSLDRFAVRPISSEGKRRETALIFERRGLFSWKLVRLELPPKFLDAK